MTYFFVITEYPEIPERAGRIRDLNKFDAVFFGIHGKQANAMDPMLRVLLEKAYEAILDAGRNIFLTYFFFQYLKLKK